MRRGLDLLLDAWRKIESYENIQLNIMGTYDKKLGYNFEGLQNTNLSFDYLDEKDFELEIANTDFVVFPYRNVTNSGVFATANSLCKPSIVSDTPIFNESIFTDKKLMFDGTSTNLSELLISCSRLSNNQYGELVETIEKKIEFNHDRLKKDIINFLEKINNE